MPHRETIEEGNVDVQEIENGFIENWFKKDKARAKSNFTRAQNRLLLLLEDQDSDNRLAVIEARKKLKSYLEMELDSLENFSNFYTRQKEHKMCERIVGEMLLIEEDYEAASKSTRDFLESHKDNATISSSAKTLTIDI